MSDIDCDFLAVDAKYWCKACKHEKLQAADALRQLGGDDGTPEYMALAAAAARPYNWHTTDPIFLEALAETHPWAVLSLPFVGTEKCKVTPAVAALIDLNIANPTKLAADIKELRSKAFDVKRATYASFAKFLHGGVESGSPPEEDENEEQSAGGGKGRADASTAGQGNALPACFNAAGFSSTSTNRSKKWIDRPPNPPTEKEFGLRHLTSKCIRGFFKVCSSLNCSQFALN